MATSNLGRPSIHRSAGGQTWELDVIARRLGIVRWSGMLSSSLLLVCHCELTGVLKNRLRKMRRQQAHRMFGEFGMGKYDVAHCRVSQRE